MINAAILPIHTVMAEICKAVLNELSYQDVETPKVLIVSCL